MKQSCFLTCYCHLNILGERPFKCHICEKAFKQSSDLKKHINLHTGANQFKCEECNMEFRRADALRKHKLGHKMGNMPCGHCGKNFMHISALRQHRAMHNGKGKDFCGLIIIGRSLNFRVEEMGRWAVSQRSCAESSHCKVTSEKGVFCGKMQQVYGEDYLKALNSFPSICKKVKEDNNLLSRKEVAMVTKALPTLRHLSTQC